jgi:AcrR family transcriptional regulator
VVHVDKSAVPRPHNSYHHGYLRDALMTVALEILERDGLEALSLRKIATAVGVSHAAPAHHFPTLRHLLTGLATVGFARFDQGMRAERDFSAPDPPAQMRAAERAYIAFATSHPALFRLMFTATLINWDDPALLAPARASRAQLAEICIPGAIQLGMQTQEQRVALEQLVWSQIHGRAHLLIEKQFCEHGKATQPEATIDLVSLLFPASAKKDP